MNRTKITKIGLGIIAVFALMVYMSISVSATVVTFWMSPFTDHERQDWEGIIADFEKNNPDIKIKQTMVFWDGWEETYTMAFASGDPPDVSYMVDWMSAKFIYAGELADLSKLGYAAEVKDEYNPLLWSIPQLKGGQYGIPFMGDPRLYLYNTELFDRAGLDYPVESWTWKDYIEDCVRINDLEGIYGDVFPSSYKDRGYMFYFPWLWNAGGSLLNPEKTKAAFNDRAGRDSLQFVVDLFNKYKVVPPPGLYDFAEVENLFMIGKVGMVQTETQGINVIRSDFPELKFGVVMPPRGASKKQLTFADWGYHAISARSKHKKESWRWLKYITSKNIVERYVGGIGLCPARNDVTLYQEDPILSQFAKSAGKSRNIPVHPKLHEILKAFWGYAEEAIYAQRSIESTLQKAEVAVNAVLAR